MNTDPSDDLFPLPLEPFEHYMLLDDRADQPMGLVRQLLLSGRLQRAAFESAVEGAAGRHPLLRALVDDPQRRWPSWVAAGKLRPRIDWGEFGTALQTRTAEYLDLRSEVGLRVWVRESARTTVVTLQFHHACTDGTGAMQFVADLLAAYAERTRGRDDPRPAIAPRRPDLLRERGRSATSREDDDDPRPGHWDKIVRTLRLITRRPTPLAPPRRADGAGVVPPPFPGLVSHSFTAEETRELKRAAKRRGATLNDLMLRDLFLALAAWNAAHRETPDGRWLRIAMPINLRTRRHAELPAANMVSYGFLTRDRSQYADPSALLSGVSAETRLLKQRRFSTLFLKSMGRVRRIRGALRKVTHSRRCFATVVLSNVGDITPLLARSLPIQDNRCVAGDVVLQSVRGCPPLKPTTRAVFHVMTYGGQMTVALRAWPSLFGLDETRDLLERFVGALCQSLGRENIGGAGRAAPNTWEERATRPAFDLAARVAATISD